MTGDHISSSRSFTRRAEPAGGAAGFYPVSLLIDSVNPGVNLLLVVGVVSQGDPHLFGSKPGQFGRAQT
jgi:hypothetical protein